MSSVGGATDSPNMQFDYHEDEIANNSQENIDKKKEATIAKNNNEANGMVVGVASNAPSSMQVRA